MSGKPIQVGIIGTGRISDLHAIEYLQNPGARITVLCDRNVDGARAKAAEWGLADIAIEDDVDRLLARNDVDLVEILLPHHLHLPIAMKAIAAGKAVSLQKPMCLNLEEADQLVAVAEASDRPFKVFENFIFYPPVLKARELIDAGAIGHAAFHSHQIQPGQQQDRLGCTGSRQCLAPGEKPRGWWPAGV